VGGGRPGAVGDFGPRGLHSNPVIPTALSWTFTPDSKFFVTNNGHVALWRLGGVPQPTNFSGATGGGAVTVTPDGTVLATADLSGGITMWDLATGFQLAALPGPGTSTTSVNLSADNPLIFSPDDQALTETIDAPYSTSQPSSPSTALPTIIRWDLSVKSLERQACAIANRNLSRAEWRQYAGGMPYQKVCARIANGAREIAQHRRARAGERIKPLRRRAVVAESPGS
jgi:WD40 repeat protein